LKATNQMPAPPPTSGLRARALAGLFSGLLVVAALAAYHNAFRGPFIFDDIRAIPENPLIRKLWPLSDVIAAPPGVTLGGRPVVSVTLALNYALGGLDVRGYHALNLGVHLLSTLVLFGIVRRTLRGPRLRDRYGERADGIAFATALIWTVHPLLSESVDYVVQRTELLMTLFYLIALYCFISSLDSRRPRGWHVAAWAAAILAMGSKEVAVTLPVSVLLYDWLFVPGPRRSRLAVHAGLWTIALAGGIAVMRFRAGAFPQGGLTSWQYLMTQAGVIAHYLRLSFWPSPLVIDYYGWPAAESLVPVLLPGLLIVGLIAATAWALHQGWEFAFLGAIFFIVLAPTSSVVPLANEIAAERRMYLPLAAVVTLVVIVGFDAIRSLTARTGYSRFASTVGLAVVVPIALLLGSATVRRNADYRSAISIWTDAVTKRPHNARGYTNLGFALGEAGRTDEAIAAYEQALRAEPGFVTAHRNLGAALMQRGRTAEATVHFAEAVRLDPRYSQPRAAAGPPVVITSLPGARPSVVPGAVPETAASAPVPNIDASAMQYSLAQFHTQQGKLKEAEAEYREVLKLKPAHADARSNLGALLVDQGRFDEALAEAREAVRIEPKSAKAHHSVGVCLAHLQRMEEAIAAYRESLRLDPKQSETHNDLGVALAVLNRIPEALEHFEEAVRLNSSNVKARANRDRARTMVSGGPPR
jgi:tetratricopeptide (TPR) repeat protein